MFCFVSVPTTGRKRKRHIATKRRERP